MADEPVVEEVVETPEVETPETPEVETPAPVVDKPATAAEIAAAVATAIKPATPAQMTAEQQESEWQRLEAESGMTRQQIIFNDNARREANLRENLPLYEENGANRAEKILGGDSEIMAKVRERMSKLAPAVRANPQAWEDAAYLERGRSIQSTKPGTKTEAEKGKVMGGTKVNSGLSEGGRGAGAGSGGGKGKPKEYSEFEKRIIATTCGGDAEAYEKFKSKDSTKPREVPASGENRADAEFKRLTKGSLI